MTTYRAVVKYALDATPRERVATLRDGLQDIACELVAEGVPLDEVETALDEAYAQAEYEAAAVKP